MAFFRWIMSGLRTIPSLIQVAILEIIGTGCLGGGVIARVLDHFGLCGHPPIAALNVWVLAWLVVGVGFMFTTVAPMFNPQVSNVKWSPARRIGPLTVVLANDPSGMNYRFLNSHPSLLLMDILAGIIPAAITVYSWGDDPVRNPIQHVYHWWLIVWLSVPLLRLFCWYVLRRGPAVIEALTPGQSPAQRRNFEWRAFWHGPLVFWTISLLILITTAFFSWHKEKQFDATIPSLTAVISQEILKGPHLHNDDRFRITGSLQGNIKHWPGGGEKYPGAAVLVKLSDGQEVIVFAEVDHVKALEKWAELGEGAKISCLVRILNSGDGSIPSHFAQYYNWNISDIVPVSEIQKAQPAGQRIMTRYVDP